MPILADDPVLLGTGGHKARIGTVMIRDAMVRKPEYRIERSLGEMCRNRELPIFLVCYFRKSPEGKIIEFANLVKTLDSCITFRYFRIRL